MLGSIKLAREKGRSRQDKRGTGDVNSVAMSHVLLESVNEHLFICPCYGLHQSSYPYIKQAVNREAPRLFILVSDNRTVLKH